MYCSTCGSEVQEGLRYCNRCGANLAAESVAPPRLFGIILALAIAAALVAVIGLVAIFFFVVEIMGHGNIPVETVLFLIVFMLTVFGIDALLIRQLSRALDVYLKTGGAATTTEKRGLNKPKSANELGEQKQTYIPAQSLHQTAPQESEQTTRVLQNDEPATRRLETDE